MKAIIVLLLLGAAVLCQAERKRYDGYKLFDIVPKTKEAVKILHDLMLNNDKLDFWKEPTQLYKTVTVMVPPGYITHMKALLNKNGISYTVAVSNVQSILDPEWQRIDNRLRSEKVFDIDDFNTLADIYTWLDQTAANCPADVTCEVYSIGDSHLGNPLRVFKISKSGTGRKAFWIDGTIHAREWLATATVLKILNHLATGGDADAVQLVNDYDWYIMPVMNPDGYEYSWTDDRLWRKNRRQASGALCYGADLNRNFDFRWGNDGVSHQPCADTFCGEAAGSEPETQAVQAEGQRIASSLQAWVTVHAYGNMWMFPWGNTINYAGVQCDLASDHNDMMVAANAIANAIEARHNTNWARGNSCEVIYATTGGTDDYAKGVLGVKYAFCPELRGNSFVVAASQIQLSFEEVWDGIVAMPGVTAA